MLTPVSCPCFLIIFFRVHKTKQRMDDQSTSGYVRQSCRPLRSTVLLRRGTKCVDWTSPAPISRQDDSTVWTVRIVYYILQWAWYCSVVHVLSTSPGMESKDRTFCFLRTMEFVFLIGVCCYRSFAHLFIYTGPPKPRISTKC